MFMYLLLSIQGPAAQLGKMTKPRQKLDWKVCEIDGS